MAISAYLRSDFASPASSEYRLTPMLEETKISLPSTLKEVSSVDESFSTKSIIPLLVEILRSNKTNSSPPKRDRISRCWSVALIVAEKRFSTSSPISCPKLSLMFLK
jgi:hypothetical protein